MSDDQFTVALNNAWAQWPYIKHTVTDFSFKDWCKRVHGFEYMRNVSDATAKAKVHDDKKYVWFLLQWS